jgi:hypothetical protein
MGATGFWRTTALGAVFGGGLTLDLAAGSAVSVASAVLHVRYAARFRHTHTLRRRLFR